MNTPRPIEIVGGGLAGLALGLALRRADVPVTLFEAGSYPRHRVCGEFIAGLAHATIGRLGLDEILRDALHHREVAWFLGTNAPRHQILPTPALGLSRHTLDARLAAAFVDAGGTLLTHTRVADPTAHPGRVFCTGRQRGRTPWIGLKLHARQLPLERDLEVHLGDDAYVGLSRIENDTVNVCGLFRRRAIAAPGAQLLLRYLEASGLRELAARLQAAAIDAASFSAIAALAFDRRTYATSRLQLGDACAMIPPFTGNGMAMAFQSAEAALDPLLAYSRGRATWGEARDETNRALRGRFRVRLASAHLLHPFLLAPQRQRWLARLNRARLLPFRTLYHVLH